MGWNVDKYDIPQINKQFQQPKPHECRKITEDMKVNVTDEDVFAQSKLNKQKGFQYLSRKCKLK